MLGSVIFLCGLSNVARGAFEDLKKEIFTVENTGKWKGKSDEHIAMLDLEQIKGGGWHGVMWTTHPKTDKHYIGKHWVEDGEGNVVAEQDFSPDDDNPLNQNRNQTTKFKVAKGTSDPLTTYTWCTLHGTWSHTWTGVQLWHFEDDVKVDEHGNEIKEEEPEDQGAASSMERLKPHEVPQHAKVSAEEMKQFKTTIYTVEAPGPWKGKSSDHVPMMDLQPVEGGGWVAELETNHRKDVADYIAKHWIEDGAGTVLGVVNFDIDDDSDNNAHNKQVSKFHVPKGAVEPLTTYAHCIKHGAWAHTWDGISLDHGFGGDKDEL